MNYVEFDVVLGPDPVEGVARPGRVEIRSSDLEAAQGIDPATIEVRDPETGECAPCRWEDLEVLPDPFDDLQGYWTNGAAPTESVMAPGMGRLYNLAAPGRHGRLVILHRARRRPTTYRVRARVRDPGETYRAVPRPWIGDGDPLFIESGGLLSGMLHARPALCDFGRGGPDLLVGKILGHILHFPYEADAFSYQPRRSSGMLVAHILDVTRAIRLALEKEHIRWARCLISGANPEKRFDTRTAEELIGFRARYGFAAGKMYKDGALMDGC